MSSGQQPPDLELELDLDPSITLQAARTLLTTFTTFLTLTLHTILYHRGLYPKETFLLAKAHNLPVPQSRHPGLCTWITDAVEQVRPLLALSRLAKVTINLHLPRTLEVAERWVFDVSHFPMWMDEGGPDSGGNAIMGNGNGNGNGNDYDNDNENSSKGATSSLAEWEEKERRESKARRTGEEERDEADRESSVNWVDVDEGIRGALRRIAYAAEAKGPLPQGSTFTIAVELKEDAPAPIGHPQPWIPSEPALQPGSAPSPKVKSALKGASTTPLRSVHAGPLFFECWVEEGEALQPVLLPASGQSQDSQYP